VGRSPEITIDESYKVRNSPASGDSRAFYAALVIGSLAATCGVGWFFLHGSAPPSGLALAGASTENPHPDPNPVFPSLEQSFNPPLDRSAVSPAFVQSSKIASEPIADTQTGGRLQTDDAINREAGEDAIAEMLQSSSAATPSSPTKELRRPVASKTPGAVAELFANRKVALAWKEWVGRKHHNRQW
jgi:hypothetical protein